MDGVALRPARGLTPSPPLPLLKPFCGRNPPSGGDVPKDAGPVGWEGTGGGQQGAGGDLVALCPQRGAAPWCLQLRAVGFFFVIL